MDRIFNGYISDRSCISNSNCCVYGRILCKFRFAILISILIDIGAQINIWRVLVVTGLRGQEVSNKVLPGLGTLISILIAFGGLAFNIGT